MIKLYFKQYKTLIQLVLDNNNLGLVIKPKNQEL